MTVANALAITSHVDTAKLRPAELARQLVQHLGPTLVALLAGVRDRKLPHKWSHAEGPTPRDAALARLQVAHRCWIILATAEDSDVARSWFIGANPRLGEESPALAIRADRFRETIAAAVAFVDGSDN
ncbi:hypothetical protein [Nocardia africana]|jgi:hypothetical protein|uniref:Antitoxin Xre/MbcA/ParS-like toxin-binding domain-containing protein n=1 Tax=Nocardia africana TaxID=134964 RepID=A0A378X5L4_9NOCA|nr:hypothetical protein [Nocardia africana]MCC3317551.1 hypothetical protein [Nocardia africana]SUA48307.1 Uncharacterised protein [Nocardia africana]